MIIRFCNAVQLIKYFGPSWAFNRILYALKIKTGYIQRKMPATKWENHPLTSFLKDKKIFDQSALYDYRLHNAPHFFFKPSEYKNHRKIFTRWDSRDINPVSTAEQVRQGIFKYFGHQSIQIGFPPNWHLNPFTGEQIKTGQHWSKISDFGACDIKIIWELNRFHFAYPLVRAYWRTGDERYAETFWQLVEDWHKCNPPQMGANWKCGQEISFRVMAWCFGLYGFIHSEATTGERVKMMAQMISVSGRRIEMNLGYALSQKNNHGISEAVGLWTVGLLFPELRQAARWCELGRQVLEKLALELIYDDGSFTQHSLNYHRLMLHAYLWAVQLGELNGKPLSNRLKKQYAKAVHFIYCLQDAPSGRVPCYGQNDGSLILPLNNCAFQDYRPMLQAARFLTSKSRFYTEGPWDEDLLWLFGLEALTSPVKASPRKNLNATTGGYHTIRSPKGFIFIRCATYLDRPGQADMLHIDLWWNGQNLAIDPGTYSYNARDPWNNPLAHTAYHNTVTVDGYDQMKRVGKFIWLPWLKSRLVRFTESRGGLLAYWEGEHYGYQSNKINKIETLHRRGIVRLGDDHWFVLDRLHSRNTRCYRLHWLFPDFNYDWNENLRLLTLNTQTGPYRIHVGISTNGGDYSLFRADERSARGWLAPYYFCRKPAISLEVEVTCDSAYFWTIFGPSPYAHDIINGEFNLHGHNRKAKVRLSDNLNGTIVEWVEFELLSENRFDALQIRS